VRAVAVGCPRVDAPRRALPEPAESRMFEKANPAAPNIARMKTMTVAPLASPPPSPRRDRGRVRTSFGLAPQQGQYGSAGEIVARHCQQRGLRRGQRTRLEAGSAPTIIPLRKERETSVHPDRIRRGIHPSGTIYRWAITRRWQRRSNRLRTMYVRTLGAIRMDRTTTTFFPYDSHGGVRFTLVGARWPASMLHRAPANATATPAVPRSPWGRAWASTTTRCSLRGSSS
jgi:hypothetical protein